MKSIRKISLIICPRISILWSEWNLDNENWHYLHKIHAKCSTRLRSFVITIYLNLYKLSASKMLTTVKATI